MPLLRLLLPAWSNTKFARMPPRSRSYENEVEALREVLKCIESAIKALEGADRKREPRLRTVLTNLQVSRNMVRHFLSNLGAEYPPP